MNGKLIRLLALTIAIFFLVIIGSAQEKKSITGTVKDEKGTTLPGVTVYTLDSSVMTQTDVDGRFTISLPVNQHAIRFSFIGKRLVEIATDSVKAPLDVVLVPTIANDLGEVIVIGYGTQKKSDVNGAISSISAKELENVPQASVDQMLQGRASGVTVTQNSGAPGSNTSVHIRGITSLSGSNEPLYVIDGVPISGDATNYSTSGTSPMLTNNSDETSVSPLSMINPSDIQDIQVLKDASATAIYGSRASNGVIIITTKKGKKGDAKLNYDGYYGWQQQNRFIKMMNLKQYANLQNALADAYGVSRRAEFTNLDLLGDGTDWQHEIFGTAPMSNHQLAVSGANQGSDYYISGGYFDQDGTIIGNNFKRYTVRVNANTQAKSWFKMGTNMMASRSSQRSVLSDNNGIVYNALLSAPDVPVYNADGSFAGPSEGQTGGTINPVAQALSINNTLTRSQINGSVYGELNFFKDLTWRHEVNGDFTWTDGLLFYPTYSWGTYVNETAQLWRRTTNNTYWGYKSYMTYVHNFDKHNFVGMLGYEVNEATWGGITANTQGFVGGNDIQTLNLGTSTSATNTEFKGSQALQSFYGRLIYTYNNRYSMTATLRSDRSSKFADGHQTGYFPSFAVSWHISDEDFWKSLSNAVQDAKLRIGYGQVGNQNVPNYLYGSALSAVSTGLGTGFVIDKISNDALTWETDIQTNVGLDLSFVKHRIDLSVDVYKKTSKNFLFQASLPAYLTGGTAEYSSYAVISPPYINGGNVTNKGIDLTIKTKNIDNESFQWGTSIVFSKYVNRVNSLADGTPYISGTIVNGYLAQAVTRTSVGRAVGEFYGYKIKDLFRTASQLASAPLQFGRSVENTSAGTWLGDIQYTDINNDGVIDENDQTYLGNPNPGFTYGISNTFSYKGFEATIFLNGVYGGKVLNALKYSTSGLATLYQNQVASAADFWTATNVDSNIPAPKSGTDNPNLYMSDRFLESASFLRIQNVNLGYTLPSQLTKKFKVNRLKVYISGQNLHLFTKYSGLDPEIGAMNQNVFLANVDLGRYPVPRTITVGINAEF
ncbi:MAG: TonB-dependent receptor [Chitinophagaceae bacterium]